MFKRLGLCALLVTGCNSSTGPTPVDVTGSWTGSWSLTSGPVQEWTGTLSQSGSAVTGTILCAFSESYAVSGTNKSNTLTLTLVGGSGDTAQFKGTVVVPSGVAATGQFTGGAGGCFTGTGTWSGELL
jgi:hypothetical protein